MHAKFTGIPFLSVLILILSVYGGGSSTLSTIAPPPALPAEAILSGPVAPSILLPSTPLAPTATKTPHPTATPVPPKYIDDRSTPSQVIVSYFNAIDRQEYSRAYNYYTTPTTTLGNFTTYSNGYADTVSVGLVFGQITSDTGMSQTYFTVPVILKAATTNGAHTNYAACYIVHQANPDVFGGPSFQPMSIDQGHAKKMAPGAGFSAALATACAGLPAGSHKVPVKVESQDISKNNFIDNRSDPTETLRSLLNSINLKQYSRAYNYFEDPSSFPGAFNAYMQGFASTKAVTVTFGTVQSEGAAGSTYYKVPAALKATTTSNTAQTFVGCYTLRLANPAIQMAPPFHPLDIVSDHFKLVSNTTNVTPLLATACQ